MWTSKQLNWFEQKYKCRKLTAQEMSKDGKFQMWDISSYMRRLLLCSVLVPVFPGSSFRLFASIAAQSRGGSCKYSGSNQLS